MTNLTITNRKNGKTRMNTAFKTNGGGYLVYNKLAFKSKLYIVYQELVLLAIVAFFVPQ